MQYKHISSPIFRFGQPDVKWIEIDDSIIEPWVSTLDNRRSLVLIDTEWGEQNIPIQIDTKAQFVSAFGYVPDILNSQKGYDYLSQYLQYDLQGKVPLYVVRVQYPHYNTPEAEYYPISYYQQATQYEFYPTVMLHYAFDPGVPLVVSTTDDVTTFVLNTDYIMVQKGIQIINFSTMKTNSTIKITYKVLGKVTVREEEYKVPQQYEQFYIQQKQPGLFGEDFGLKIWYDGIYTSFTQEVGIVEEFVPQSRKMNSATKGFETFTQDSLTQLITDINSLSKHLNISYVYQNPETHFLQPSTPHTMKDTEPVVLKNHQNTVTYTEDLDYYVDYQQNKIHLVFSKDRINILSQELNLTYTPTGEADPVIEVKQVPAVVEYTTITEVFSNIWRSCETLGLVHDIYMQCLICVGEPELETRYTLYDNKLYYSPITNSMIYNPTTQNTYFNPQKSMDVNFEKVIEDLVLEYKIDNQEDFSIQFIATLGLNKHSFFQD